RVEGAAIALEHLRAGGGRAALGDEDVLVRERDAHERARVAGGAARIGGPCGGQRALLVDREEGAGGGGPGAHEQCRRGLAARDRLVGERARELRHAQVVQLPLCGRAGAHSITFGTRNSPSCASGALAMLRSRASGSVTASGRRRRATSPIAESGV